MAFVFTGLRCSKPYSHLRRALCHQQHLTELTLHEATAVAHPPTPSHLQRPQLALLAAAAGSFTLKISALDSALPTLHALARSTELPAHITIQGTGVLQEGTRLEYIAVKGWTPTWLASALSNGYHGNASVVLVDDGDVDTYIAAQHAASQRSRHALRCPPDSCSKVYLGEDVTPTGFRQLLGAPQLPNNTLDVDVLPAWVAAARPYIIGWTEGLQLTPEHFKQLAAEGSMAATVEQIRLQGCQELTCQGVVALALKAPQLKRLELLGASGMSLMCVYALAQMCPRLERLVLGGALEMDSLGVFVVLVLSPSLRAFELQGVHGYADLWEVLEGLMQLRNEVGPGDHLEQFTLLFDAVGRIAPGVEMAPTPGPWEAQARLKPWMFHTCRVEGSFLATKTGGYGI
jgi:hypothetical protein